MITTQTAFPDAEATVFNITLRFSDAIKDLTFEAPFDELSAWQTVGGVGGAIELVSQPDDHVIEERLWAVQEGQVTVQVKDMVFRRTSDDQANTPSNELIVHSGQSVGESPPGLPIFFVCSCVQVVAWRGLKERTSG